MGYVITGRYISKGAGEPFVMDYYFGRSGLRFGYSVEGNYTGKNPRGRTFKTFEGAVKAMAELKTLHGLTYWCVVEIEEG